MKTMKSLALAVIAVAAPIFLSSVAAEPPMARIIDGNPVSEFDYPYVARLTVDGELLCTGTLISPKFVLTAAHCFFGSNNNQAVDDNDITARIGGVEYATVRATIHPAYRSRNSACVEGETDAAVLELAAEVPGVTPISLLATPVPVGASVVLAGYGTLGNGSSGENGNIPPVGTIYAGSTIVEGFGETESTNNPDSTYFYWTFDSGESNTASGDSGGPAFYSDNGTTYIAGITCGGYGNAEIGTVSFDTRADLMKAWVESIAGTTPSDTPAGFTSIPTKSAYVGQAFSFNVPVTGTQPILLSATGLPDGLTLSGSTISGTPTTEGTFNVQLSASNIFGGAVAEFDIVVTTYTGTLTIKKALLQFDYSPGARDFLDLSGTITVGPNFKPNNAVVEVQIGRFVKTFTLKADGSSKGKPTSYFDLVGTLKGSGKNASFKKTSVKYFLSFSKTSIFDELATLGFPASENASAGQEVSLPLSVTINGLASSDTKTLSFRESDARWSVKK